MPDPSRLDSLGPLADQRRLSAPRMMSGQFPDEILNPAIRKVRCAESHGSEVPLGAVRLLRLLPEQLLDLGVGAGREGTSRDHEALDARDGAAEVRV